MILRSGAPPRRNFVFHAPAGRPRVAPLPRSAYADGSWHSARPKSLDFEGTFIFSTAILPLVHCFVNVLPVTCEGPASSRPPKVRSVTAILKLRLRATLEFGIFLPPLQLPNLMAKASMDRYHYLPEKEMSTPLRAHARPHPLLLVGPRSDARCVSAGKCTLHTQNIRTDKLKTLACAPSHQLGAE